MRRTMMKMTKKMANLPEDSDSLKIDSNREIKRVTPMWNPCWRLWPGRQTDGWTRTLANRVSQTGEKPEERRVQSYQLYLQTSPRTWQWNGVSQCESIRHSLFLNINLYLMHLILFVFAIIYVLVGNANILTINTTGQHIHDNCYSGFVEQSSGNQVVLFSTSKTGWGAECHQIPSNTILHFLNVANICLIL